METLLYLDTARLGAMHSAARRAIEGYLDLATTEACSPAFENFLHHGYDACPLAFRDRYPGLSDWQGFAAFKRDLPRFVELPGSPEILIANRTSHLMRLATRLLFLRCRRVLVTDLEWPAYRAILDAECHRDGHEVVQVPLRMPLFVDRCSAAETTQIVTRAFHNNACDGLFLSGVTYEGLRLPVQQIASALKEASRPPFVVVDGAQALGHTPTELGLEYCDFYLAGTHKWLRTSFPMGLAFCPRRGTQALIRRTCLNMMEAGQLDDPLLRFTWQSDAGQFEVFGETVSLASLFPCAATIRALLSECSSDQRFERLLAGAKQLEAGTGETGWAPLLPDSELRSAILLLQSDRQRTRDMSRDQLRHRFQREGIALTAYDRGVVRLSAIAETIPVSEMGQLQNALLACA